MSAGLFAALFSAFTAGIVADIAISNAVLLQRPWRWWAALAVLNGGLSIANAVLL